MTMKPSVRLLFDYLEAAGIDTREDREHGVIAEATVKYGGSGDPVDITVTRVVHDVKNRTVDWSEVRYLPAGEPPGTT